MRFIYGDVAKTFNSNLGLELQKPNPKAVTAATELYFIGESLHNIIHKNRFDYWVLKASPQTF